MVLPGKLLKKNSKYKGQDIGARIFIQAKLKIRKLVELYSYAYDFTFISISSINASFVVLNVCLVVIRSRLMKFVLLLPSSSYLPFYYGYCLCFY